MFSKEEKRRRLDAAAKVVNAKGLDAIYLLGNGIVGTNTFGNFRYFVDNRVFFFLSSAIITKDGKLTAVVNNNMGKHNMMVNSFADDAIINVDQLGGVIDFFKANNFKKIGVLLEIMPTSWYQRILKEIPGLQMVDVSADLFPIRLEKSDEEVATSIEAGKVADIGYEALCKAIKPGMYEHEALAICEGAMHKAGMDTSFMLVASGQFSATDNKLTTLHHPASINRKLEDGDTVSLEITPAYNGYWSQLVRTICIGKENPDVKEFAAITDKSIAAAAKLIKPGVKISEIANAMKKTVEDAGYIMNMPIGHICGTDLNEERLTFDNDRPLKKGMVVIMHPTIVNDKIKTGIYWGESYLVTDNGCECVCGSNKEVFTAK